VGASTFTSAKVTLGETAVFQDYANAAVNALNAGQIGWFTFGGNTYVVADMGADSASGFVNGSDFIVKLTGTVDLTNASFNAQYGTIGLV
jgi:S-layer protein